MYGHGAPVASPASPGMVVDALTPIENWCLKHIGKKLPVTNIKDFGMIELWDDRAVQVVPNTGEVYLKP